MEAFLDDIFDRALDANMKRRNLRLKALQKRIKGGGKTMETGDTTIECQSSEKILNELQVVNKPEEHDEESDWYNIEDNFNQKNFSLLCNFEYKTGSATDCDAERYLIIPNQEYEYSKILRTFLKDKKTILKLDQDYHESDAKNKNIFTFREKAALTSTDKSCTSLWLRSCAFLSHDLANLKKLNDEGKTLIEFNYSQDSLSIHQEIFKNNWHLLSCDYTFSQNDSDSTSIHSDSLVSSLSNSFQSTYSTNLSNPVCNNWTTTNSSDSSKSNLCDELKMYVDSIGISVGQGIVLDGKLSSKIKGGLEKSENVSVYLNL